MRTVKPGALVQSDNTATSEDAHLTPPPHWLPGRGTLYGGRAGREPLSLNAGDPIVTVLALVSSSAPKKRHGVLDRASDLLREDYRVLSGHGCGCFRRSASISDSSSDRCPLWVRTDVCRDGPTSPLSATSRHCSSQLTSFAPAWRFTKVPRSSRILEIEVF